MKAKSANVSAPPPTETGKPFFPPHVFGIVADQAVVLSNLTFMGALMNYVSGLFPRTFVNPNQTTPLVSLLILTIFGLRLAGLYLKRLPLQARLQRHNDWRWHSYLIYSLFAMLYCFAPAILTLAFALLPFGEPDNKGPLGALGVPLLFGLVALDMLLFLRASCKPLTEHEKAMLAARHWRFSRRTEFFANAGLFFYMIAWQGFATYLLADIGNYAQSPWVIFFPLTPLLFFMFYLAPRHLFSVEDFRYRATKISLALVYVLPLLRFFIK